MIAAEALQPGGLALGAGTLAPAVAEPLPSIVLQGARLHAITEHECVKVVCQQLAAGRGGWIMTMNLDHLRCFRAQAADSTYHRDATIVVADGMPLVWASRLQGSPLPERVTGSNLIWSLSAMAAQEGRSVFLLGGNPGTADGAAAALATRFPGLRIGGIHCPPRHFEDNPEEITRILDLVQTSQPDIVYVALGSPKTEWLIHTLRAQFGTTWWMGVGIAFSFITGDIPRAPLWMQQAGLEWLHRLSREPRRLAGRYLLHDAPFGAALLAEASVRRFWPQPA